MKYTEEQLSRVLTAHAAGLLVREGIPAWRGEQGCANQFAYNEPFKNLAFTYNRTPAMRFDNRYTRTMTPEALLHLLEPPPSGT